MANRDRTDPNRSAQSEIFRGAGEGKGNQLGAEGGTPGSDVGTTTPRRIHERERSVDSRPRKQDKKRA